MKLRQILAYSSASLGINLISLTAATWLLYFWAPPPESGRITYVSAGMVGLILGVGRIWDAVIDPLIGYWSDSLRSTWGRRRPFIFLAGPCLALMGILLWTPPSTAPDGINGLYLLLVSMGFYSCLSLVGIPYDSSLPEQCETPDQRVLYSMWKNILGTLGVLLGAVAITPLFNTWGAATMGAVTGLILLITLGITLACLQENPPRAKPEPLSLNFKAALHNRAFRYLVIVTVLVQIVYGILLANLPYWVTLVLDQSESAVGIAQGVVVLAMILSAPLWNALGKSVSEVDLLRGALLWLGGSCALVFSLGTTWTGGLIALALVGPALSGYFIVSFAMMGTVAEAETQRTGERREALFYGAFSLAQGIGPALAALVLPGIYTTFGYGSGARGALLGCAVLGLLSCGIMVRYPQEAG